VASVSGKQKRALRTALAAAVPVAVFAAVLALLSLLHTPYGKWLAVEMPGFAVAGGTLDIRITLGQVPEPSLLVVNLYLLGKNHSVLDSLRTAGPSPYVRSGGTYSFRAEVVEKEKLALAQLVIYLSPTGRWRDRTHAASSQAIPVRAGLKAGTSPGFKKVRSFVIRKTPDPEAVFQPAGRPPEPVVYGRSPLAFRLALYALLAAGCLASVFQAVSRRSSTALAPAKRGVFWPAAAGFLLMALIWELFGLEGRLSAWARRVVLDLDVYYFRQTYQKVGIALIAAGIACTLILAGRAVRRDPRRLRPALAGMALAGYLGVCLAGASSYHYMDVLRQLSLAGVLLSDLAKAACAAAFLLLAISPGRRDRP
jgi:hypothetical protein